MRTITKKDIAKRTADLVDGKVYHLEHIINAVFTSMRDYLMEADPEVRIEIRDFGVFEVKKTLAKPKARNPKTGEVIYVKPRRKTHFKPGKILKNELKKPLDEL
jgi:integration host factor subunit beta